MGKPIVVVVVVVVMNHMDQLRGYNFHAESTDSRIATGTPKRSYWQYFMLHILTSQNLTMSLKYPGEDRIYGFLKHSEVWNFHILSTLEQLYVYIYIHICIYMESRLWWQYTGNTMAIYLDYNEMYNKQCMRFGFESGGYNQQYTFFFF